MKPWLQLARISNLPTVWTNVTAAWLLAGGKLADTRLCGVAIAGSLLYTGGMILNDAADAGFDREHRRERPIPGGQVSQLSAWVVSVALFVVGSMLAVISGADPRITAFLVSAIVFYDLYHKQWSGSVVIMGACRTLLYLMAASAVTTDSFVGTVATVHLFGADRTLDFGFLPAGAHRALPAAVALGSYIVGITIAARLEHKDGVLAPGPALLAFGLLYAPAIVCTRHFVSGVADPWSLVILGIFAALVFFATQILRKGGPSIGRAVGLLLAGIATVDALAVSSVSIVTAFVFVALAPLLRLWQRWIAAT